ncbi:unnamed protein product [Fraxinus pennsylvanica]|uniref:Uncharacterized protein n=1 Tax=Fraxinus pennsylvanica TaxID=56036 RepID=A0AAD1Z8Q7_9LAMI|nr:unnamed protein product [Fraxinus pennsylvanica]
MADHGKLKSDISFAGIFASSAFAACFAEICTIPLDTAKVRLQLQKKDVAGDALALPKYKGLLGTVGTIAREEGLTALWKGIVPGLHRQCLYGGLRIGLYEPVKTFYVGQDHVGDAPLSKKILAALTTGAVAITVANPTDLVKVRLQAEGKLPPGVPRQYSGALNAYSTIVRQEGIAALWTGLGPNVARNAIINAAELASYDQVKQTILKIPGFTDNVFTHLLSDLGAGTFSLLQRLNPQLRTARILECDHVSNSRAGMYSVYPSCENQAFTTYNLSALLYTLKRLDLAHRLQ